MAQPLEDFVSDPDIEKDEFELEDNTPMYDETGETFEQTETSFSDLPAVPETESDIRSIETRETVNNFYNSITDQGWEVDRNAPIEYKAVFIKDPKTKYLYVLYDNKQIKLTSQNPNKFLAISTIQQKTNTVFIRDVLGVIDYASGARPKIPPVEAHSIILNQITPASEQVENIPLENLGDAVYQVNENLETALHEVEVGTDPKQINIGVSTDDFILQQEIRDLK